MNIQSGDFFRGYNDNWPRVFGKCYEVLGNGMIRARIYTPRARAGDNGVFPISQITDILTEEEFNEGLGDF